MLVSEIFYSLQGEGELIGVPSVFVRLSGCNLRCNWCDTPFASWNPEGETLSIDQIIAQVSTFPARHVVLTGGEPMIASGIRELATEIKQLGYHITIETAATIAPEGIPCDLASLSPKLANSAPDERLPVLWRERHEKLRWQPEVVRAWLTQYPYQLKFVVATETDVDEIESMLCELGEPVPRAKVLLMPEGTSLETLRTRSGWLSELCKARGYRYAPRLHIELYGNRRGT
ncbi:MAG: 7-carboxy-7-deazaguanine synthase QueE [Verrucomicrobia bacterium]|nr:7-carboxy-7-deazaguanine synthase QueE [Verrucomicrobiota bacterium]